MQARQFRGPRRRRAAATPRTLLSALILLWAICGLGAPTNAADDEGGDDSPCIALAVLACPTPHEPTLRPPSDASVATESNPATITPRPDRPSAALRRARLCRRNR